MTFYEQVVLMMQLKTYQTSSMFLSKEMTFKISIQDGNKLHYLQVKYLRKYPGRFVQDEDGRVCSASDSVAKKLFDIEQCQALKD